MHLKAFKAMLLTLFRRCCRLCNTFISGPEMLDYFDLPYTLAGDGEQSMVEFARALEDNTSPGQIQGLIIREKGLIKVHNPPVYWSPNILAYGK